MKSAAPDLIAVMQHPAVDETARTWAMIALAHLGPPAADAARPALVAMLADPSPTHRRSAIELLKHLDDVASCDAIARLLDDDTLDPAAWFEEDGVVSAAARAALDRLGASATVTGRQTVHVFISIGRFGSFEEMREYVDQTYTEDGEAIPSAFMREVELHDYEPMAIEAVPSDSGRPVTVAALLAHCAWAGRWLPALDGARTADAALCVFSPNLVPYPERCALEHLGVVHFVRPEAGPA